MCVFQHRPPPPKVAVIARARAYARAWVCVLRVPVLPVIASVKECFTALSLDVKARAVIGLLPTLNASPSAVKSDVFSLYHPLST